MRRYSIDDAPRVPLHEDDRDCLKTIYRTRRRLFLTAFTVLFLLAWIKTSSPGSMSGREDGKVTTKTYRNGGREPAWYHTEYWPVTLGQTVTLERVFLFLVLLIPAGYIYQKRIASLRRDLIAGEKAQILHTITGKREFPHTGQYFLLLDNPDCLNQEVPADTYKKAQPGDRWASYIAPYSKHVFNNTGRFELM